MAEIVTGTNCGNCQFFTGRPVLPDFFNRQGGLKCTDPAMLQRAREADLVTLPGMTAPMRCRICAHPKVAQPVDDRMCCALWDNPGARREWRA